jgi:hypothetical protein
LPAAGSSLSAHRICCLLGGGAWGSEGYLAGGSKPSWAPPASPAAGVALPQPFRRMTYLEAQERYGSDKPDLRYGLDFKDLTEAVSGCTFRWAAAVFLGGMAVGAVTWRLPLENMPRFPGDRHALSPVSARHSRPPHAPRERPPPAASHACVRCLQGVCLGCGAGRHRQDHRGA